MKHEFIGPDIWKHVFNPNNNIDENKNVIILRGILFFHAEEKTTLAKIREYFTDHAISKLSHDNFIKIG